MSNSKLNDEINAQELIIVKHFLKTPMHRAQLESVTGFKYLQKKLKDWSLKGEIYRQERTENKKHFIYFSTYPIEPIAKPVVLPKQLEKPKVSVKTINGNSTIYRLLDEVHTGGNRSRQRNYVSGSTLSGVF